MVCIIAHPPRKPQQHAIKTNQVTFNKLGTYQKQDSIRPCSAHGVLSHCSVLGVCAGSWLIIIQHSSCVSKVCCIVHTTAATLECRDSVISYVMPMSNYKHEDEGWQRPTACQVLHPHAHYIGDSTLLGTRWLLVRCSTVHLRYTLST